MLIRSFSVERSVQAVSGTRECFNAGFLFYLLEARYTGFQTNVPDTFFEIRDLIKIYEGHLTVYLKPKTSLIFPHIRVQWRLLNQEARIMALHVYGINYRTAPIQMREHMAIAHEKLAEPLANLLMQPSVSEAMILATCNRCELYTITDSPVPIKDWLNIKHSPNTEDFSHFVYEYYGEQAMRHLLRVACGLDSLALGESQILGQLKKAFNTAKQSNAIGPYLGHLVENVLANAKKIRRHTGINEHTTSIASTAVSLAKNIFTDFSGLTVLLIGAGETAELVAHHFHEQGVKHIITANRTLRHAQGLAKKFSGKGISLMELPAYLSQVDIVISTTASPQPVLNKLMVQEALASRDQRPMYIIDIAMPRDVEPAVAELPGVHLFNVDDLQGIAQEGLQERRHAAEKAEHLIDAWLQQYQQQLDGKAFIETIKSFRQRVEDMRSTEVRKALQLLKSGNDPEHVLLTMANTITKKMMHYPTIQLRRASQTGNTDLLDVAKQLFDV